MEDCNLELERQAQAHIRFLAEQAREELRKYAEKKTASMKPKSSATISSACDEVSECVLDAASIGKTLIAVFVCKDLAWSLISRFVF